MGNMKPPKVGGKLVPVITDVELSALLAACKGSGFENRRDNAVISLFRDTGARLSELSGLGTEDVSAHDREAVVTGKGDKQRTVKYTYNTARALDRYMRERARHPMARVSALWLGVRGGPMTSSGVYQMIERRASQAGVRLHPHMFRHTFSKRVGLPVRAARRRVHRRPVPSRRPVVADGRASSDASRR
jgi:site-specific recombinase XerD